MADTPIKDEKFDEQVEMTDAYIDEIREKLGDDASKITEQLLGIKTTVAAAGDIHTTILTEQEKIVARNKDLLEVNNNLFIKNAGNLNKRDKDPIEEIDDEDAVEAYVDLKASERKK